MNYSPARKDLLACLLDAIDPFPMNRILKEEEEEEEEEKK